MSSGTYDTFSNLFLLLSFGLVLAGGIYLLDGESWLYFLLSAFLSFTAAGMCIEKRDKIRASTIDKEQ